MKRGLFFKYVTLFVGLVSAVLVINAALDLYFVYQDNRRASIDVQREKAVAASQKIESFVREIEHQIGWVAYPQWAALPVEQRRFEYFRLQRQAPAITELAQLDRNGHEQLKISRLSMDVIGSDVDRSAEPAFIEAVAHKVYFGPVYYRKESEPYLTMAVAHGGRNGGVTVAEINLKFILDVISQIKVGKDGYAYVVDRQGRLVAHPDISLVLRGTDMNRLAQVKAAQAPQHIERAVQAENLAGRSVLSAHAAIPALGWLVFVEMPTAEVLQPVFNTGLRDLALLVIGLAIAGAAAALLARRMVVPIRAMQAGAERIGGGDLGHRLAIRTGDELEALADQFNRSAEALEESRATLEQRVADRTHELTESLEQQTATAGILQVISSSPTDAQPVFDAIADSAIRLLNGWSVVVWRYDGERLRIAAVRGGLPGSNTAIRDGLRPDEIPFVGDAIRDCAAKHIVDVEKEELSPLLRDIARTRGWRANIAVPMVREGQPIGLFSVSRAEPGAFSDREVRLLETFADQAVIAVQNVRLFSELSESLDQQTATAEILQIINSSPGNVAPVFDAILAKAMLLCDAAFGLFNTFDGRRFHTATTRGVPAEFARYRLSNPADYGPGSSPALLIEGAPLVHVADVTKGEAYRAGEPNRRALADLGGARSLLIVALRKDGALLGMIGLYRQEVRPFADKQIALLQGFAAQAVIAMENARLITEQREALEQQTATAEILRVISQSPTDVQPVLEAVVAAACEFCGAPDAVIILCDGGGMLLAAHEGPLKARIGRRNPLDRSSINGRATLDGRTIHIPDVNALDPSEFATAQRLAAENGIRAFLAAPMLRAEGGAVGCVLLRTPVPGSFTPRQIELLETFAAQAVIAIENVRLFTEIQEKSRQLEVASQHKSQFLANMSHELRTPLNAILGYTEMMTDGLYGALPDKAQSVLERVQSNGRHLLGLINDVLDLSKIEAGQLVLTIEDYSVADMVATVMSATESLARTKGIALGSAVAPGLPRGRGDARRLTQVLLNLVGNAIKFTDQGSVELRGARAGDAFELSIIDTGFGIAPDDQAKIFEEFQQVDNSSTRKKGGTGLGLSISRKIVELHGGRITVQSEVGKGSTFTVAVPIDVSAAKDTAQ